MASSSTNPNPCSKSAKAKVIYQKLCKWPVTDRAIIDSKYVRDLWKDIYKCLNEAPSALLPKEIALDIVARVPTNFMRWCFILRTIWNGKTDGLIHYKNNSAIVHCGYHRFHSTVFINSHDFFNHCQWSLDTLFELGFLNGFILGPSPIQPNYPGISEDSLSELPPFISNILHQWYKRHKSITVWIETITPEWSNDYSLVYHPIHLIRIIPSRQLTDWRLASWPSRPKLRFYYGYDDIFPEEITFRHSCDLRALSADSVRRSLESNTNDKDWQLFTTIEESYRSIVQGYNKIKFPDSLEIQVIDGLIPMSLRAKRKWEDYQFEDDPVLATQPNCYIP